MSHDIKAVWQSRNIFSKNEEKKNKSQCQEIKAERAPCFPLPHLRSLVPGFWHEAIIFVQTSYQVCQGAKS